MDGPKLTKSHMIWSSPRWGHNNGVYPGNRNRTIGGVATVISTVVSLLVHSLSKTLTICSRSGLERLQNSMRKNFTWLIIRGTSFSAPGHAPSVPKCSSVGTRASLFHASYKRHNTRIMASLHYALLFLDHTASVLAIALFHAYHRIYYHSTPTVIHQWSYLVVLRDLTISLNPSRVTLRNSVSPVQHSSQFSCVPCKTGNQPPQGMHIVQVSGHQVPGSLSIQGPLRL